MKTHVRLVLLMGLPLAAQKRAGAPDYMPFKVIRGSLKPIVM